MNISEVRKNLSTLVKSVADNHEPIIIVQDSRPVAEIVPYSEAKRKKIEDWRKDLDTILLKFPD